MIKSTLIPLQINWNRSLGCCYNGIGCTLSSPYWQCRSVNWPWPLLVAWAATSNHPMAQNIVDGKLTYWGLELHKDGKNCVDWDNAKLQRILDLWCFCFLHRVVTAAQTCHSSPVMQSVHYSENLQFNDCWKTGRMTFSDLLVTTMNRWDWTWGLHTF